MKAAVSSRYGPPDVIEMCEVPTPQPGPGEILIRVHATTVSRTDDGMLRPHPFFIRLIAGLFRPHSTILGMDFAGAVAAIGTGVTSYKPGDCVFGMSPDKFGAHAEYLCISEHGQIAAIPEGLRFDEVVVCEGAWYATTCLDWLDLKSGDQLLIYGASGAIGTAALQLAKSRGLHVTAVVGTRQVELVNTLGADLVVDYMMEEFTKIAGTFDAVLDAVGKTTYFQCQRLLKPTARYATTDLGPFWQNLILAFWSSIIGSNRVNIPFPKSDSDFVESIRNLLTTRELRAVVDRRYPLEEIIDAYRYVESEQKTGIVVVDVAR